MSHPCGNLVDGLPHDCHTETVAKRARVGPRTPVVLTLQKLFRMEISCTGARLSDMIVLDDVLKIWIELIKWRNGNAMKKFYRLRTFQKLIFLVEISKISKIFEKIIEGSAPALRVIPAGTRLTVHRSLPYSCLLYTSPSARDRG